MYALTKEESDREINVSALKVGLFFFFLYFLTLSKNLSLAHDASTYYGNIVSGKPYFHPHHLLYESLSAFIVNTVAGVFPKISSLIVAEIINAAAGGGLLAVFYKILRKRIAVPSIRAFLTCGVLGFSFSIWAYATTVEVCLIPIFFLFLGFYVATPIDMRALSFGRVFAVGVIHGAAMLFHQIHFLFGFCFLFILFSDRASPLSRRFLNVGIYLLAGAVIVAGTYAYAAHQIGVLSSVDEFKKWFFAYAARSEYYSRPFFQDLAMLIGGWARTLINGYFVLGADNVFERFASRGAAGLTGSEDRYFFLMREMNDFFIYLLTCLSVFACMWTLFFFLHRMVKNRCFSRAERFLMISAIPYVIFFAVWEPFNPEFHIVQWIIFSALFVGASFLKDRFVAILAGMLFVINGAGYVLPAMSLQKDLYYQSLKTLASENNGEIRVITGSNWIYGNYFPIYRPDIKYCGVTDHDCDQFTAKAVAKNATLYVRRDACVKPHKDNQDYAIVAVNSVCNAIHERDKAYIKKTGQFPPPSYLFYRIPDDANLFRLRPAEE